MRPSIAFNKHRDAIREIALRHRVENIRVFGSVLHGEVEVGIDLANMFFKCMVRTLRIKQCYENNCGETNF